MKPVGLQHTQTDNISTQSMQIIHSETRSRNRNITDQKPDAEHREEHFIGKFIKAAERLRWGGCIGGQIAHGSRRVECLTCGISNKTKEAKIGERNDKNSANCECVLGLGQGL